MHDDIGNAAGVIWHALNDKGDVSLAKLKTETKGKPPVFDWTIGWLAREDKIVITRQKRGFLVQLKDTQRKPPIG